MVEEKKKSRSIEEIATLIYNVKTIEDCEKCSSILKGVVAKGNLYSCLSDYLTFRTLEIRHGK